MIIDAHAHVGGGLRDISTIRKTLKNQRIDKVVLSASPTPVMCCLWVPGFFSWLCAPNLVYLINRLIRLFSTICRPCRFLAAANQQVFDYQQQIPEKIIQFYWFNPVIDPSLKQLKESYSRWQFAGIKLNQGTDAFKIDSPGMQEMVDFARENELPVFIHLYQKEDVADFIRLAANNSTVTFIAGHMIGAEKIFLHRVKLKNIYIEISPPWLHSRQCLLRTIKWFGADRVVFGSDTPYGCSNIRKNLDKVNKLPISQTQKDQILGRNIAAILCLKQNKH